ncbi:hypothetical protein DUK53_15010 [Listeria sp. SHR_NRA_18]|uniref:hypothetical protein n=1 Tax=Listeria sp. SHR_NRA_18 TaxID=2269046 RepID=UPI000F5ED300|nr:hypothetical protein [Listeria sp. SHR_NRA_18]RQW65698.1 hypothetical protein DUK53_15010 [Listeria sp. SHR_NRA_18]
MIRKLDIAALHKLLLAALRGADVNAGFSLKEETDATGKVIKAINYPATVLTFITGLPEDTKTSYGMTRYLTLNIIDEYDSFIRIYEDMAKIYGVFSEKLEIDGFTIDAVKGVENDPSEDNGFLQQELQYTLHIQQIMEV